MKLLKHYLLLFVSLLTIGLAVPVTAQAAYNPFSGVNCGDAAKSVVCRDRSDTANPISGPDGLILQIVNIVAFIGGAVAVIMIIIAGLRLITGGGNSDTVASARRTVLQAAIGIVIILLSETLVRWVVGSI